MTNAFNAAKQPGISFAWSDLTREEVKAGGLSALIFLFGYHGVSGTGSPIRKLY
jgi:hypothetical protein